MRHMNARARRLGMRRHAVRSPPTGSTTGGYSTPATSSALVRAAERPPAFGTITATRVPHDPGPARTRDRVIQNRNALLWLYPGRSATKTGYDGRRRRLRRRRRRARRTPAGRRRPRPARRAVLRRRRAPDYGFEGFERDDARRRPAADRGRSRSGGGTVPVVAARASTRLVPTAARTRRRQRRHRASRTPRSRRRPMSGSARLAGDVPGDELVGQRARSSCRPSAAPPASGRTVVGAGRRAAAGRSSTASVPIAA